MQREEVLRWSEEYLRILLQHSRDAIELLTEDGTITYASESLQHVLGYQPEDCIGTNLFSFIHLDDQDHIKENWHALLRAPNTSVQAAYRIRHKDGSWAWIEIIATNHLRTTSIERIVGNVRNITQQKRAEAERSQLLAREKEQLEAILHNVANGITVHDANGTLLYTNNVAANMIGFPSAEAMLHASLETYQQILDRYIVKDEEGNKISLNDFPGRRALREGRTIQVLFEYTNTLNGHTNWSLIKSQPIFHEDGQAQLVVNVMTDVSEQQALEQRKNEFISMASHELKTPVTALKGFVNLLQRRSTRQGDKQALHYLARMDGQLNKLANLINDLLDLSKIQAGNFALREETVDLTALIDEIIENVQGITTTHNIRFVETAAIHIMGDKDRLGQVLINLLTNAIKYSPKADTVIVRTTTDGEQAIVSVQDFGIGITETHQQHVFERFYQVTDPQEKTYPGLGIGLYIAHDIIKRHHGAMWIESSKGNGATFFFTVPLAKGSTPIEDY
jgi:two-component system phosphate regulon sensor histidine kinase PhoR